MGVRREAIVLVPSYGFVMVDRTTVQFINVCRPRPRPRQQVTKLVFKAPKPSTMRPRGRRPQTDTPSTLLVRLVEIIGPALTSQGIHAEEFNDDCLQQILSRCSQLENLFINSRDVSSLAHLRNAYEQGIGSRPSSINLKNVSIPVEAIDAFLERLGRPEHPMYKKIRRFAIGERWSQPFAKSTADQIDAMLARNRRLAHLYLYDAGELSWYLPPNVYTNELITGSPVPSTSHMAFLSVVKHCFNWGASSRELVEDVARLIFDFAIEATYRVVIRKTRSSSRTFYWNDYN